MWMMGYNVDDGELSNMPDSFNGRKLRPLILRPTTCISTNNNNTAATNAPCLSRMHGTDLLALNHHLGNVADESKREFNTQQVVVSSRWNPTPEQLQTLEELYRRGTRTPSADQIQHITSQLRRYGKIEGKNVFYWFQNHKARERQKRRRQLESVSDEPYHEIEPTERKESGANRTSFEVDQTRSWALPTNFSTFAEKTASIQRATKAGVPECRTDGWVQLEEEGELQQRRSLLERNATWQMMHLSSCSPPTHLINTTNTSTAFLTGTTTTTASSTTTSATVRTMDPKLIKNPRDLNIFRAPAGREDLNAEEEAGCGASETLQLFPLWSGDGHENVTEKETEIPVAAMDANFSTHQFFEFLPLKN